MLNSMLNSIGAYFFAVLYWWWVMVLGVILPTIDYVVKLGDKVPNIPNWALWTSGILGIVIAQFLAFHKVRMERERITNELRQHENTHPDAEVEVICDGNSLCLDVKNSGHGKGDFQAQILQWQNVTLNPKMDGAYDAMWLNNNNEPNAKTCRLIPDQRGRGRLLIAKTIGNKDINGNKGKLQEIMSPSGSLQRAATVDADSDLLVKVEVLADPKLTKPCIHTYVVYVTNTGIWKYCREVTK